MKSEEFITFAAMNEKPIPETWSKNVILADADYIDHVAFNLIVNFERMLERRIPQADLARWIDCVALDGGIREQQGASDSSTQVILLHSKNKERLENFLPGRYQDELDGKAFKDNLGEFLISCVPVEQMTTMEDLFMHSMRHIRKQEQVENLMLIADDRYIDQVLMELHRNQTPVERSDAAITVFTMQPVINGPYNQQILGFSLMSAMGINSEEIEKKRTRL